MYYISDKKAAIREVQKYLYIISQSSDSIPHVTIDGFYNEETADAVKAFQKEHSLPVSGAVDKTTFDMLFVEYTKYLLEKEYEKNVFNKELFPLKAGSSGNDVLYLNTLIRELAVYYKDLELPYGDFYSSTTENSVKMLQEYFIMEKNGTVSINMLERLKAEVKARKNFPQG